MKRGKKPRKIVSVKMACNNKDCGFVAEVPIDDVNVINRCTCWKCEAGVMHIVGEDEEKDSL